MRTTLIGSVVLGIGYMLMVDALVFIGFVLLGIGVTSLALRIRRMEEEFNRPAPKRASVVELIDEAIGLFEVSTEIVYSETGKSVDFLLRDGSVVRLTASGTQNLEVKARRRRKPAPRVVQPVDSGPPPLSDEDLEYMANYA